MGFLSSPAVMRYRTVYGDIGTSPLYVYSATFDDVPPNGEEILGALSLILWCLFLVVTVKYVIVTLRADDAGEGGTVCGRLLGFAYRDLL